MRCVIITAYTEYPVRDCIDISASDFVICADASYKTASDEWIEPDMIIGDFDSDDAPPQKSRASIVRVPAEKDDTDTLLCIKKAISLGYSELYIIGGIGGRLDHTLANIQTLAYAEKNGVRAVLLDRNNTARIISGKLELPRRIGYYLSVFAYGGECEISLSGVKYLLSHKLITPIFPLGVSNVIISDNAQIEVFHGCALVIESKDK